MQTIQDSMRNFQDVNPYEMLYRNMNLQVDPTTNKETAEKIARQLGFIHNTYGVIAKDLIKLLSFVYGEQQAPKNVFSVAQKSSNVPSRYIYPSKIDQRRVDPEPMDVEEISVRVSKQSNKVEQNMKWRKKEIFVQEVVPEIKNDKKLDVAPNLDIFGEFAFEKTGYQQAKNQSKDKSHLLAQQKISRIVQDVVNKRKKSIKRSQQSYQQQNVKQLQMSNNEINVNQLHQQISYNESLNIDKKSKENPSKQENVKTDFVFNNEKKKQQRSEPLAQFDQNSQRNQGCISIPPQQLNNEHKYREDQKLNQIQDNTKNDIGVVQNKLWHLMRKPQQILEVYQISDDD